MKTFRTSNTGRILLNLPFPTYEKLKSKGILNYHMNITMVYRSAGVPCPGKSLLAVCIEEYVSSFQNPFLFLFG